MFYGFLFWGFKVSRCVSFANTAAARAAGGGVGAAYGPNLLAKFYDFLFGHMCWDHVLWVFVLGF